MNRRGFTVALGLLLALMPLAQAKDFIFSWARWSVTVPGVLLDNSTGLQWTQHDNGVDINWNDAMEYCSNLDLGGRGWRLPSEDELAAIYDANALALQKCSAYDGRSHSCT